MEVVADDSCLLTPGGITEADVTRPLVIQTSLSHVTSSGPNSSSTDTASEACSLFNSPRGATSLSPSESPGEGRGIHQNSMSDSSSSRRPAGDSVVRRLLPADDGSQHTLASLTDHLAMTDVRVKDMKRRVAHQKFTPKVFVY